METMNDPPVQLTENALRVLRHRYLAKDGAGRVVETPAALFSRVASFVASAERRYGATGPDVNELTARFRALMAEGVFLPNSPTLMNAGRELGLLSACFVLPVDDSVEAIFESVKLAALIQKAGGGTGFAFDRLRPTGDYIASSGGTTSGPISFWRVFSEATNAIQQGAFRRGANMGMMSITHPDILKFIDAKSAPGAFENFNISVKVTDAFMSALRRSPEAPHVVVNPRTGRRYVIPRGVDLAGYTLADLCAADRPPPECYSVGDVWDLIVQRAHASGEPGLCFIDRVNADNPTPALGRIEATNPCGEQPLLDYEACNLGSVNLGRFVRGGRFDEDSFRRVVRLAVRFLDDVIDVNNYLAEPIRRMCLGNRKVGLGVMGFADALMMMGLSYDSDEAVAFGRRAAQVLMEEALSASAELAEQRGPFPNFTGSRWDKPGARPLRNAALTTVAPTGTISMIAGCSGGIEPVFALAFWRNVLGGQRLLEVNAVFRAALQQRGLWSEELAGRLAGGERLADVVTLPAELRGVFITAHEVPPARHVQMQAAFQEHIDGAISKTVNLPADATAADVDAVFRQAYDSGCKGVTVYRHGCRPAQPMDWDTAAASPVLCPRCGEPLDAQVACSRCPRCGYTICS
ncbi:MAG: ribonucleoside-diphosphate reductase, adenosylcobalamin-dependent [Planctomycetales bacterium 4484_123]|nr:MAG: ribonucleoside-diphosphate reductase, adenosylcobalamin-dependent [Planctomycetales bacterium 4484_123]